MVGTIKFRTLKLYKKQKQKQKKKKKNITKIKNKKKKKIVTRMGLRHRFSVLLISILNVLSIVNCSIDPIAYTLNGPYKGYYSNITNTYVFKGIRYAQPPVNEFRWKSARKITVDDSSSSFLKFLSHKITCCVHKHTQPHHTKSQQTTK